MARWVWWVRPTDAETILGRPFSHHGVLKIKTHRQPLHSPHCKTVGGARKLSAHHSSHDIAIINLQT